MIRKKNIIRRAPPLCRRMKNKSDKVIPTYGITRDELAALGSTRGSSRVFIAATNKTRGERLLTIVAQISVWRQGPHESDTPLHARRMMYTDSRKKLEGSKGNRFVASARCRYSRAARIATIKTTDSKTGNGALKRITITSGISTRAVATRFTRRPFFDPHPRASA